MTSQLLQGDALEVLKTLPAHSVDAIVTDPPAGISFMAKDWDSSKGGRDQWVNWLAEIFTASRRVLKPGGHALVWSIPRTSHWTAYALEDAGFEIRDAILHLNGEGMPKSHNISKAIDRMAGATRQPGNVSRNTRPAHRKGARGFDKLLGTSEAVTIYETAPATPEAAKWEGWGTGLKPAVEIWHLARAPLAENSIAANVLEYGTGAINIDATRIETGDQSYYRTNRAPSGSVNNPVQVMTKHIRRGGGSRAGRWPSNLLLSHTLFCQPDNCSEDCPIRLLDDQSGTSKGNSNVRNNHAGSQGYGGSVSEWSGLGYDDQGGASRYFQRFYYCGKAQKKERNAGLENLPARPVHRYSEGIGEGLDPMAPVVESNYHPTVKPINLMRYLARLITPPGGTVLDIFAGSGSTLVACVQEGFSYVGIEQKAEYVEIARARIKYAETEAA